MIKVVGIRFKPQGKIYFFNPLNFQMQKGDYAIVETARGIECGEVAQGVHEVTEQNIVKELKKVTRVATQNDIRKMQQNKEDEEKAFKTCEKLIQKHKLEMKLVDVEYAFDRSKMLFCFTADGRIDFRELVRDLAAEFRTRIELRQIGVRDESKMLGGIGVCGQPFCCSRFLTDFQPVSIKMAKEQGLSLNSGKISGSCGRLMCCLSYEQSTYEYLNSITPPQGSYVSTPEGNGFVTDVLLVSNSLKVKLEKNMEAPPKSFTREECKYISGGTRKSKFVKNIENGSKNEVNKNEPL